MKDTDAGFGAIVNNLPCLLAGLGGLAEGIALVIAAVVGVSLGSPFDRDGTPGIGDEIDR